MTELICPYCGRGQYSFVAALELDPRDGYSDEIQLQVVECRECSARFGAMYEESRRGRLDSECFHHRVISKDPEQVRDLERVWATCPDPHDAHCGCPVHRAFGRKGSIAAALASLRPPAPPAAPRSRREVAMLWAGVFVPPLCCLVAGPAGLRRTLLLLVSLPASSVALWLLVTPAEHAAAQPAPLYWRIGVWVALLFGAGCAMLWASY